MHILLYDTTLRDGTQRAGLSLSLEDKLKIAHRLDALGIHYIEGGWPGSNPKDAEFFRRIAETGLRDAKVAAFGSTRRAGVRCADDPSLEAYSNAYQQSITGQSLTTSGSMLPLSVALVRETTVFREYGPLAGSTALHRGA